MAGEMNPVITLVGVSPREWDEWATDNDVVYWLSGSRIRATYPAFGTWVPQYVLTLVLFDPAREFEVMMVWADHLEE